VEPDVYFEKVEQIVGHYVRLLLDNSGLQAEAEAEISDAFKTAEHEIRSRIRGLEKRIANIESFLNS